MQKVVSKKNNIDNLKASKENFAQLLEESFSKETKKVGGLVKGTDCGKRIFQHKSLIEFNYKEPLIKC